MALYAEWQEVLCRPENLHQKLNAFGLTVAAVYDRRWLTIPALIETPLQVKTARYTVTHNTKDFACSDQLGILAITLGDFYRLVFHKP